MYVGMHVDICIAACKNNSKALHDLLTIPDYVNVWAICGHDIRTDVTCRKYRIYSTI